MMLILESLLAAAWNHLWRWLKTRASTPAPARPQPSTPPGHLPLGHVVPLQGIFTTLVDDEDRAGGAPWEESAREEREFDGEILALSPTERQRHIHVLGSTGSGKTNLLRRLLEFDTAPTSGHSVCLLDCRGDLVEWVLQMLARRESPESLGHRLVLLDLRQRASIVGFNPLGDGGDPYSRAFYVLGVLQRHAESWGVQLEETLRNTLLALALTKWTLLEVEPLLTDAAFRAHVLTRVTDRQVRAFFARYDSLSEEQQATWRLPVLNKFTAFLAYPQLRLMLGQRRGLSFEQLFNQRVFNQRDKQDDAGIILLVSLAQDQLHGAAPIIGSLLISAFETAIMARVARPGTQRAPVFLYLDEFQNFKLLSDRFEPLIAEGRRLGLSCCLSHQNLAQLTPDLRHLLRNNVGTTVCLRTGALDALEMEKQLFPESRLPPGTGGGESPSGRESPSGAEQPFSREMARGEKIMTGGDLSKGKNPVNDGDLLSGRALLMRLPTGQALVARAGHPTVRVHVPHYPTPPTSPIAVERLREAASTAWAHSEARVEQELAERDQWMATLRITYPGQPVGKRPGAFRQSVRQWGRGAGGVTAGTAEPGEVEAAREVVNGPSHSTALPGSGAAADGGTADNGLAIDHAAAIDSAVMIDDTPENAPMPSVEVSSIAASSMEVSSVAVTRQMKTASRVARGVASKPAYEVRHGKTERFRPATGAIKPEVETPEPTTQPVRPESQQRPQKSEEDSDA